MFTVMTVNSYTRDRHYISHTLFHKMCMYVIVVLLTPLMQTSYFGGLTFDDLRGLGLKGSRWFKLSSSDGENASTVMLISTLNYADTIIARYFTSSYLWRSIWCQICFYWF